MVGVRPEHVTFLCGMEVLKRSLVRLGLFNEAINGLCPAKADSNLLFLVKLAGLVISDHRFRTCFRFLRCFVCCLILIVMEYVRLCVRNVGCLLVMNLGKL